MQDPRAWESNGDNGKNKQIVVGDSSVAKKESLAQAAFSQLERHDYAMWATKTERAMEAHEIWDAVDPEGDEYKCWVQKRLSGHVCDLFSHP